MLAIINLPLILLIMKNNRNTDKPVLVGGVGEKNFGKQYRQGNRVYSSEHIAMCLNSSPVGNTGGYSYLYLVRSNNNEINRENE